MEDEEFKATEGQEIVCHALIWDEQDRLLLLLRSGTRQMDGFYAPPGGHVQKQESQSRAIKREVLEEVGLQVNRLGSNCILRYTGGVNHIYSVNDYEGEPQNCEPNKCSDLGWFHLNKLPENTVPWLTSALQGLQEGSG